MQDSVTYLRSMIVRNDEAANRFDGAARRWQEESDTARRIWDDAAGRALFEHLLDPYRMELETAVPAISAATQGQRDIVDRVSAAHLASVTAYGAIRDARSAAERAQRLCDGARAQAASAYSEAAAARRLAGDVAMQLGNLEGG